MTRRRKDAAKEEGKQQKRKILKFYRAQRKEKFFSLCAVCGQYQSSAEREREMKKRVRDKIEKRERS